MADKNAVKIEVVTSAIRNDVMIMTDQVSESCQELKEKGYGICFRMRLNAPDNLASESVECRWPEWFRIIITQRKW